jgi:glucose/arabinose dehydrogenase
MSRVPLGIAIIALLVCILVLSLGSIRFRTSAPSIEIIHSGLQFPDAFTFLHDGRMLYNEKNTGNVKVILGNGTILKMPFTTVRPLPPGVDGTEQGLLGIASDPHFDTNSYVYVYWTYWNGTYKHTIISRFTAVGNTGTRRTDIFDFTDPNPDQPPSGPTNHNGGYIKFGPDGKLYVEIGDFCSWDCLNNPLAQDRTTYAGKILRLNPDGSVPSDNPFSGNLIWALGYRNGFGLDFSPTGKLIATMAGPDCCDKIMFIYRGANYGWPSCVATCSSPYVNAIYQWGSPTVTPTGIAYSLHSNVLYFGEYNTGNLMQLTVTANGTSAQVNTLTTESSGILAVERGPDGRIYFSTSDTIYRFTPPASFSPPSPMVANPLMGEDDG